MRSRPGFVRVVLALGISLVSSAHLRTISEGTARKLVRQALSALGENPQSIEIDPWRYYWAPEFYTFEAWRYGLAGGLATHYFFAVNPWTGDVWDAMACKRITSPVIEREQEAIWKRSLLPTEAREALHEKSPACSAMERKMSVGKPGK